MYVTITELVIHHTLSLQFGYLWEESFPML